MRNDELERVIAANLDDPGPYGVYADWLQAQGDPRGELIVLAQRGSFDEVMSFVEKHEEHFLGPFARRRPPEIEINWRHGFVQGATLGWDSFGDSEEAEQDFDEFLGLESCRFIERLSLGPVPSEEIMSLVGLATAIERRAPETLRELYLGGLGDWDISGTETRLPDSQTIPNVQTVTLRAGSIALGAIDLPALKSFTVETGGLTTTEISQICRARWPALERLMIWFGEPNYGASGGLADIQPILDGEGLPNLKRLGLMNCTFVDQIAAQLPSSKILPQLESIDLSMGNLSDDGVAAMLAEKARFAHLSHLNLDDNALTQRHWPAARDLAHVVVFGNRHDPDRAGGRYASVGE